MAVALVLAWAQNAHADELSQLTIAPTGQVMVRGAVVTAVDGYTVTATSKWGSASLQWSVQTTGSTAFIPRLSSADALKAIKVGDTIEFNGSIDSQSSSFAVTASSLRDTSLVDEDAAVSGQVISVMPDSGIFLINTGSGTTTVAVSPGAILTLGGDRTSLSDIEIGDTVNAWGSLNLRTQVLSATKASFSLSTPSTVSASGGGGIFSSIIAWLSGSRGALSVRDR